MISVTMESPVDNLDVRDLNNIWEYVRLKIHSNKTVYYSINRLFEMYHLNNMSKFVSRFIDHINFSNGRLEALSILIESSISCCAELLNIRFQRFISTCFVLPPIERNQTSIIFLVFCRFHLPGYVTAKCSSPGRIDHKFDRER